MGEHTKIEWADHTFNPWIGCTKVSPACANCYAEREMDKRLGKVQWGPNGTRVMTSPANWKKPLKWNRDANFGVCVECGKWDNEGSPDCQCGAFGAGGETRRPRVFCASLADVFEDWGGPILASGKEPVHLGKDGRASRGPDDRMTLDDVRRDLFALIDATPNLDWLLLTKRPENVRRMWPSKQCATDVCRLAKPTGVCCPDDSCDAADGTRFAHRSNVWIGTSVENQEQADRRIPELLKCRDLAPVLFISMEPLLGPVKFDWTEHPDPYEDGMIHPLSGVVAGDNRYEAWVDRSNRLDWIIAGGESGPHARPSHPDWFRSIRDQCQAAGVPFFFKQWGDWLPIDEAGPWCEGKPENLLWPAEPNDPETLPTTMFRVGKKLAGQVLDGREWSEFPKIEAAV